MPPRKRPDLSTLVAEMRRLGVTEYQDGDLRVKLDAPPEQVPVRDPSMDPPQLSAAEERAALLNVPLSKYRKRSAV